MKLNEKALANASAIFMGITYLVCALFVAVLPDFSKAITQSWFHGIDIVKIWSGIPFQGNFVSGLGSAVVASWLSGWIFAWIYNRLVK